MEKLISKLIDAAWPRLNFFIRTWQGLLIAIALTFLLFLIYWDIPTDFNNLSWQKVSYKSFIFLATIFFEFLIWKQIKKLPRGDKDKINIAIAYLPETESESKRLKSDFIDGFKSNLTKVQNSHLKFKIFEIPEWFNRDGFDEKFYKGVFKKTSYNFLLYLKCKQRKEQGKNYYVLEIENAVTHAILAEKEQQVLREELNTNFRKFLIQDKIEISGFAITANLIALTTKYILGLAAGYSGKYREAYSLLNQLFTEVSEIKNNPLITAITFKVRSALIIIIEDYLAILYEEYRKNKDNDTFHIIYRISTQELLKLDPENYKANLLLSIYYFKIDQNPQKALSEINKCIGNSDSTWLFSKAFLEAYLGNLDKANDWYKKANRKAVTPYILEQIETFIHEIINEQPEKYELWFCSGVINLFFKGDEELAKKDFKKFIDSAESAKHANIIAKVKTWTDI